MKTIILSRFIIPLFIFLTIFLFVICGTAFGRDRERFPIENYFVNPIADNIHTLDNFPNIDEGGYL